MRRDSPTGCTLEGSERTARRSRSWRCRRVWLMTLLESRYRMSNTTRMISRSPNYAFRWTWWMRVTSLLSSGIRWSHSQKCTFQSGMLCGTMHTPHVQIDICGSKLAASSHSILLWHRTVNTKRAASASRTRATMDLCSSYSSPISLSALLPCSATSSHIYLLVMSCHESTHVRISIKFPTLHESMPDRPTQLAGQGGETVAF